MSRTSPSSAALWFLVLVAAAGGCGRAAGSEPAAGGRTAAAAEVAAPPATDLGSPDRALQSYWRLRDSSDALPQDTTSAGYARYRPWRLAWQGLFTGAAAEAHRREAERTKNSVLREILDVQQQTSTRAVITARLRNTSPIPPGATPTEYDVNARRDGEVFHYVMEKDAAGWKIAQIQRKDPGDEEWRNIYGGPPLVPTWVDP